MESITEEENKMATTNAKLYKIPTGDLSDSYVDLKTAQAVGGVKNFTNGIKLNGSVILNSVDVANSGNSVATTQLVSGMVQQVEDDANAYTDNAVENAIDSHPQWTTQQYNGGEVYEIAHIDSDDYNYYFLQIGEWGISFDYGQQQQGYFLWNEEGIRLSPGVVTIEELQATQPVNEIVTSLSSSSTNKQLPTAKSIVDYVASQDYGNVSTSSTLTSSQLVVGAGSKTVNPYTYTIGSNNRLWYLNAGVPTNNTSYVGGQQYPVYLSYGTITRCVPTSYTRPMLTMKYTESTSATTSTTVYNTVFTPSNNSIDISKYTNGAILYLSVVIRNESNVSFLINFGSFMVAPWSKLNSNVKPTTSVENNVCVFYATGNDAGGGQHLIQVDILYASSSTTKVRVTAYCTRHTGEITWSDVSDWRVVGQLITCNQ